MQPSIIALCWLLTQFFASPLQALCVDDGCGPVMVKCYGSQQLSLAPGKLLLSMFNSSMVDFRSTLWAEIPSIRTQVQ